MRIRQDGKSQRTARMVHLGGASDAPCLERLRQPDEKLS